MLIELANDSQISFKVKELKVPELLNYAKLHLPQKGLLKLTSAIQPYCYLDIEDDFIHQLFPLLPNINNLCIPNYFNFAGAIGAHISVIYQEEMHEDIAIDEIGKSFSFVPYCLYEILVFNKRLIALIVQSSELESLRLKYGFPVKLNYRGLMLPFHITIAAGSSENLLNNNENRDE